ncbi:10146_t:CDS:2, partial [Entrophospora sp. SA101]
EVELLSPSSTNGLLDIINNIDKLSPELPEYLKNENRLAFYNIICLFDNTFPYISLKSLIDKYRVIIDTNTNLENFNVNLNKMITGFLESPITEVAWSEKGGGFLEVVGNALIKNTLFKNEDLEKLLKVMMLSLWHKNAHHNYDELKFKLQSFGILVYDVELEFWQIVNVVISVKRFKDFEILRF